MNRRLGFKFVVFLAGFLSLASCGDKNNKDDDNDDEVHHYGTPTLEGNTYDYVKTDENFETYRVWTFDKDTFHYYIRTVDLKTNNTKMYRDQTIVHTYGLYKFEAFGEFDAENNGNGTLSVSNVVRNTSRGTLLVSSEAVGDTVYGLVSWTDNGAIVSIENIGYSSPGDIDKNAISLLSYVELYESMRYLTVEAGQSIKVSITNMAMISNPNMSSSAMYYFNILSTSTDTNGQNVEIEGWECGKIVLSTENPVLCMFPNKDHTGRDTYKACSYEYAATLDPEQVLFCLDTSAEKKFTITSPEKIAAFKGKEMNITILGVDKND